MYLSIQRAACAVALTLGLFAAAPSVAALGGDAGSVSADTVRLRGVVRAQSLPAYDVHEIITDGGVRVREFLAAGRVFAVAWSGPVVPDLQTLLGAHYAGYAQALSTRAPGLHKSLRIHAADLVVESGGHLRAYVGRAYLNSAVPAGTTKAELQ